MANIGNLYYQSCISKDEKIKYAKNTYEMKISDQGVITGYPKK